MDTVELLKQVLDENNKKLLAEMRKMIRTEMQNSNASNNTSDNSQEQNSGGN